MCSYTIFCEYVLGIVIACGDNTVMGHIAGLTARLSPNKTPIARELEYFMKIISTWACFLGIVFGSAAIALDYSWVESALFLIGIIVANVPEGSMITSKLKNTYFIQVILFNRFTCNSDSLLDCNSKKNGI